MNEDFKDIYINFALLILQKINKKEGKVALIPLKNKILYAYSKILIDNYYTSPIYEVICEYLKILDKTEEVPPIFCTCFPTLEELIFICNNNINIIYFIGEITDKRIIDFLNSNQINLKIVKLELNN
jgi:hypothetical protein